MGWPHLATVDLKEAAANHQVFLPVLGLVVEFEDVRCCQCIDTLGHVLVLAVEIPSHGLNRAAENEEFIPSGDREQHFGRLKWVTVFICDDFSFTLGKVPILQYTLSFYYY